MSEKRKRGRPPMSSGQKPVDDGHHQIQFSLEPEIWQKVLVALLIAAILAVNLSDIDTDVISAGVLVLMLCACAVAGVRRG